MMNIKQVCYTDKNAPEEFTQSFVDTGFAVLRQHPIPTELIMGVYEEWDRFFHSSEKQKYRFDPVTQSGYFPFRLERAKGYPEHDLKEFYHYYPKYPLPAQVSKHTPRLRNSMNELAETLLQWIEKSMPEKIRGTLSIPLVRMIDRSEMTLFRIIHYPAMQGTEPAGAVRAAAHEDINLITLLPAATKPGLQVKDVHGTWYEVECDPGTIVINAGDMLQEATNGYFPSTTHRVVNPPHEKNESRLSMPLFLHPRPDVVLSPRYTADAYLKERLKELGLLR